MAVYIQSPLCFKCHKRWHLNKAHLPPKSQCEEHVNRIQQCLLCFWTILTNRLFLFIIIIILLHHRDNHLFPLEKGKKWHKAVFFAHFSWLHAHIFSPHLHNFTQNELRAKTEADITVLDGMQPIYTAKRCLLMAFLNVYVLIHQWMMLHRNQEHLRVDENIKITGHIRMKQLS